MGLRRAIAFGGASLVSLLVMGGCADALDLNGAWASDADNCTKVFVRKGTQIGFTDMSDVFGGGFIVDGDRIIGKFASCRIKARKDSGPNVNMIAACATDMMLSSVQRAGPGCLDSAPRDLSGFLPGYAERGALRFCRCVGRA
jgi:hypothetical protein